MPNIPISELGHLPGYDRHNGDSRCAETRRRVSAFGLGRDTKGTIDLKLRHDEVPGNLPCVDLRPGGFRKLPTNAGTHLTLCC